MNKPSANIKKLIKLETALMFTFIALVVGFVGGVVFSGFKMQNTLPISSKVASDEDHSDHVQQILDMEKKVAEAPEDVNTWIALGNAYFDHQQPEKAIPAYETALKYQPDNADVWTDIGIMYRQSEKPEEAIAAFDRAQAIDPTHEVSLFNKGIVQMHDLNEPESAAATWSKLLELNPSAATQSGMLVKDLVERLQNPQ